MNSTRYTIQLYWQHARRYPQLIFGVLVSIPLTVLATSFLPPLIVAGLLNRLGLHQYDAHHVVASFWQPIALYAVVLFLGGVGGWRVIDTCTWRLEGNVERDIARRVFKHLLEQSPDFHANHFGGSLVSQTNKLMGSYVRFADTIIFQVLPLLWALLFAGVILATRSGAFAAVLIVFAILYMVSSIFVTKTVRRRGAEQAAADSRQTGNLADAVTNVMAIKSFAGSHHEQKRFAKATDETHWYLMRQMHAHNGQQIYFTTLSNFIQITALVMAVFSATAFHVNLATVFLIISYTSSISSNLFQFSNTSIRNINRSLGDAADMVGILREMPGISDPSHPETSRITRGDIIFSDVTFTHNGAERALFNELSVHIKAGEKVGLVGHSGSGKTTFTRLLLRFNDITSGTIAIDNHNINTLTQDDLRSHIAYVPQEPILFHRSLSENISYGKTDATQREIEIVAQLAYAHDFISLLPNGYETTVGERGVKLSGGQRQRIAIARAMIKNAPILVLDEATSSLDSESELLIQRALWQLMEGRTAIVVAHRLSTIQKMDRIIVLEDGKIVEQGSHKELIRLNGHYARLWAHQSGGFIEE